MQLSAARRAQRKRVSTAGMRASLSPRPLTQSEAPDDRVIVLPDGGVILPSILSPISRGKRRQSRQSPSGGSISGTSPQLAHACTSPDAEQPPVAESLLELGRVLSLQRQGLSTLLQLHRRQSLSPDKLAPEPTEALSAVLDELVATEANYVADLRCATSAFSQPLADLLPSRQHQAIFGCLPQLLSIHEDLESELDNLVLDLDPNLESELDSAPRAAPEPRGEPRGERGGCKQSGRARGRGVALCRAFLAVMPHFERCYARYSSTYTGVGDVLRRARQEDAAVDDFISGAERASGCALGALLFRPVQRMCVYPLLFQQVLNAAGAADAETARLFRRLRVRVRDRVPVRVRVHTHHG